MAGGSLSILRRKGKQFRDKRGGLFDNAGTNARGTKLQSELLSNDIQSLLQIFHDEAAYNNVSTKILL